MASAVIARSLESCELIIGELEAIELMLDTKTQISAFNRPAETNLPRIFAQPEALWRAVQISVESGAEPSESAFAEPLNLSVRIGIDDMTTDSDHESSGWLELRATLAADYPSCAPLSAAISLSHPTLSKAHEAIVQAKAQTMAEECVGGEAIWAVLEAARESMEELSSAARIEQAHKAAKTAKAAYDDSASDRDDECMRVWMWFHHIKSSIKKGYITSWAREQHVSGLCKPGYPGVLVVVGRRADCVEYTSRLRALVWKAMSVRAEEDLPGEDLATAKAAIHEAVMAQTGLGCIDGVAMLQEGDMGKAAEAMKTVGRGGMFRRIILKIMSDTDEPDS